MTNLDCVAKSCRLTASERVRVSAAVAGTLGVVVLLGGAWAIEPW
jgi:hypothetical protein